MEGFPSTCKAHLEFCHLAPREAQASNHRTIMVARSSILNSRLCCQFHTTRLILYYFTNSYEFGSLVSNLYQLKTNLLLLPTFPFSSPLSITCESCLIVLRSGSNGDKVRWWTHLHMTKQGDLFLATLRWDVTTCTGLLFGL